MYIKSQTVSPRTVAQGQLRAHASTCALSMRARRPGYGALCMQHAALSLIYSFTRDLPETETVKETVPDAMQPDNGNPRTATYQPA